MLKGRILCLDIGEKRIGVAVSDLLGYTAQGVEVMQSEGFDQDIKKIRELIKKYDRQVECETMLWDERFSTKEAQRALDLDHVHWRKKRQVIDKMAAQIILQGYLEYESMKKLN